MKKLLLSLLALVVLGIGAYGWANRISEDELPELLTGEYELRNWEVSYYGKQHDSLLLRHLPKVGEKAHFTYSSERALSFATQSSNPMLQKICFEKWDITLLQRHGGFLPSYSIVKDFWPYTTDTKTDITNIFLKTYCRHWRTKEYDASLQISIYDKNYNIHWQLCFDKK